MKQPFPIMVAKATIFISMLIILSMSIAVADNYYIATSGNDSNNGTISSPWKTVKHVWRNSGGGDTVFVREGTYNESEIWLQASTRGKGIESQFWTLMSYPGEIATFTNSRFIADADYVCIQGLHLTGTSYLESVSWGGMHERIEFLNNDFSGETLPIRFMANNGLVQGNKIQTTSPSHGIYVMHGDGNIIRNNYVANMNKHGIHIYDENKYNHTARITNLLVENNTVIGSKSRSGIIISAGESTRLGIEIDGVVIRNNIVLNNAEDGITIRYYGSVRNVDIFNNVIYGNRPYGLRIIAHDVDNVTIKNNIFASNRTHINVSSRLNNFVDSHNLYWQPSSIGSGATDDYAVYQDPLFVNVTEYDFHLREGSPAIDAGVDVGIPYNGDFPDLGAFEYDESSAAKSIKKLPNRFNLQQNYPNPFNPSTNIHYDIAYPAKAELNIYNIQGQLIQTLVNSTQTGGNYTVKWDGSMVDGNRAPSGIYIYKIRITGNNWIAEDSRKMLLLN